MFKFIIVALFVSSQITFAQELANPGPSPGNEFSAQSAATSAASSAGALVGGGPLRSPSSETGNVEKTAFPAIVGILIAAGMQVAGHIAKQVAKNLSEQAAKTAARNFARQQLEKKGKNCFSVKASTGDRILLAADKATVIFAGNHDAYMRAIADLCH